jgi:hypothetical protein
MRVHPYAPAKLKNALTWRRQPIADCNKIAFQDAVQRSRLAPLRWHDLRHTFAS